MTVVAVPAGFINNCYRLCGGRVEMYYINGDSDLNNVHYLVVSLYAVCRLSLLE